MSKHEVVSEKKPLGKTQSLLLNKAVSRCTSCQTDYIAVDENKNYIEAGWIKTINGDAYLGRVWFDSKKGSIQYDYAASAIKSSDLRHYSQVVNSPSRSAYCRLVAINYENMGTAYFDDIIFLKLQLPELSEEESR